MADAIAELMVRISANNEELKAKMAESEKAVEKASDGMREGLVRLAEAFVSVEAVMRGLEDASEDQHFEVLFNSLIGNGEKAEAMMGDLAKAIEDSPLTKDEAFPAAQQLLNFGIGAENVGATLGTLQKIASGTGVAIGGLANIYGRVMNDGIATSRELLQLQRDGVPINEALAQAMGVTTDQIKELGSQGKITADDFSEALTILTTDGGKFATASQDQMATYGTQLKKTQEALGDFLGTMGKELLQPLTEAMRDIQEEFKKLEPLMTSLGSAIAGAFNIAWGIIKGVLDALSAMPGPITAIGVAAGAAALAFGPWGAAIAGVTALVGILTSEVDKNNQAVAKSKYGDLADDLHKAGPAADEFTKNAKGLSDQMEKLSNVVSGSYYTLENYLGSLKEQSKAYHLTYEEALKVMQVSGQLTAEQKRQVDGELAQIELRNQINAGHAKTHEIVKARAAAESKAAEDAAKRHKEELDAQNDLRTAIQSVNDLNAKGLIDDEEALKRKISLRQSMIDKIEKEAESGKKLSADQLSYLETLIGYNNENQKQLDKISATKSQIADKDKAWLKLLDEQEKAIQAEGEAMQKAANDSLQSWDGFWETQKASIMTNQQLMENFASSMKGAFGSVFTELGKALKNGENGWQAMGKAAVHALGAILKGIGDQLVAMSVVAFATGNIPVGSAELAGAATAYTAGGILSAYASGTRSAIGGYALVGEQGPEIVKMPRGAEVIPNHEIGKGNGGLTLNVYSPAASAFEIAQESQRIMREMAFTGVI